MRGGDPAAGGEEGPSAATNVDLFACFSSAAYNGLGGDDGRFFSVYGALFDELWSEETEVGSARVHGGAPFGGRGASWETARDFYRDWDGFSSRKTFAFADKWSLADAPGGDYRRAMEKENRRERAKAKKELNAAIRELVAFVKKRDPRIAARKAKEAEERAHAGEETKRRARETAVERQLANAEARAARDQILEQDAGALDEILASIALDERIERKQRGRRRRGRAALDHSSSNDDGDGSDADASQFDKAVPSNEEEASESNFVTLDDPRPLARSDEDSEEPEDELHCAACRKPFRTLPQMQSHERSKKHLTAVAKLKKEFAAEGLAYAAGGSLSTTMPENPDHTSGKHHPHDAEESVDSETDSVINDIPESWHGKSKKQQKKLARKRFSAIRPDISEEDEDDQAGGLDDKKSNSEKQEGEQLSDASRAEAASSSASSSTQPQPSPSTAISKKQKRRAKKSAAKEKPETTRSAESSLLCNARKAPFQTRNKLMRHVEERGHALHVDSAPGSRNRR